MTISRRTFLSGLLAAPAIITTPGLLMPVRPEPIWTGVDWGSDDESYIAFMHPDAAQDHYGFVSVAVADYADRTVALPMEIGRYESVAYTQAMLWVRRIASNKRSE